MQEKCAPWREVGASSYLLLFFGAVSPLECFPGDGLNYWHAVLDSENQEATLKMPPHHLGGGSKASEVTDLDKNKIVFPG